jgi:hypothetical protein
MSTFDRWNKMAGLLNESAEPQQTVEAEQVQEATAEETQASTMNESDLRSMIAELAKEILIEQADDAKVKKAADLISSIDFDASTGAIHRNPYGIHGPLAAGAGRRHGKAMQDVLDLNLTQSEVDSVVQRTNLNRSDLMDAIRKADRLGTNKGVGRQHNYVDQVNGLLSLLDPAGGRKRITKFTTRTIKEPEMKGPVKKKAAPKKDSMVADKKPEGDPTVAAVQSGLIAVGIDVGEEGADGLMGPATRRAIRQFQKQALGSSGAFGPRSVRALIDAIESDPGRKAMHTMTLSALRDFEGTGKTLKQSKRRPKKKRAPAAPEAPKADMTVAAADEDDFFDFLKDLPEDPSFEEISAARGAAAAKALIGEPAPGDEPEDSDVTLPGMPDVFARGLKFTNVYGEKVLDISSDDYEKAGAPDKARLARANNVDKVMIS